MAPGDIKTEKVGPLRAVGMGAQETWFVVDRTLSYIGGVFAGREAADQLGGPIRIAQVSGQVATAGFAALIHLTAVLSVSIGLLNLFPIPLLDGGHLLFYAIEAIRGRPLSERAQEFGFRIGLAIVVMLMIFATFNDILHSRHFLTVADGQLFEGKGKLGGDFRLQRGKNAVQSWPMPEVCESASGAAAEDKRARSAWDFVCGWFGDWP